MICLIYINKYNIQIYNQRVSTCKRATTSIFRLFKICIVINAAAVSIIFQCDTCCTTAQYKLEKKKSSVMRTCVRGPFYKRIKNFFQVQCSFSYT